MYLFITFIVLMLFCTCCSAVMSIQLYVLSSYSYNGAGAVYFPAFVSTHCVFFLSLKWPVLCVDQDIKFYSVRQTLRLLTEGWPGWVDIVSALWDALFACRRPIGSKVDLQWDLFESLAVLGRAYSNEQKKERLSNGERNNRCYWHELLHVAWYS